MNDVVLAIKGEIAMSKVIIESIDCIYDYRVPSYFMDGPVKNIVWMASSLSEWIKSLLNRHRQLNTWITSCKRPPSFWLPGFILP